MPHKISLTGIKPTGTPHIGNYIGAIKPALELASQNDFEAYYFIADYHALTGTHDGSLMSEHIYEVAASWLALGLNPEKTVLYQQSSVPEILELTWILSCFTPKGLLNRAHAYKASVDKNQQKDKDPDFGVSMGLYNYPVLMASDILFIGSDVVPVGADQMQHIEIARDIAHTFNHNYGDLLKAPTPLVQKETSLIPGLDGRKMSKSYNNHIPLFLPEKKLRKMIMRITTDSTPPEEPKDPEKSNIFLLYKAFADEKRTNILAKRYKEGIGWGEAKQELFDIINENLQGPREKYDQLMNDRKKIISILNEGTKKVRPKAQLLLTKIKKAIGTAID